jgi:signal transduction histidine kinase
LRTVALLQQRAASLEGEIAQRIRAEEELRVTMQRLDAFIGVAGHELRSPLTSMKMTVQLGQRRIQRLVDQLSALSGAPGDLRDELDRLCELFARTERQVARQQRLVDDLLDLSRIQSDRFELRLAPCDLVSIVCEAVKEQHLLSPERTIDLALPEQHEAVQVLADADRIEQVVTNYLTNALKYAPEEAPVAVGVQVQGRTARVYVRDRGPGLPPEEQAHIWERFRRVPGIDAQGGSHEGLGLGLYISKVIIEQHGGEVGVESAPGAGRPSGWRCQSSRIHDRLGWSITVRAGVSIKRSRAVSMGSTAALTVRAPARWSEAACRCRTASASRRCAEQPGTARPLGI